MQQPQLRPGFAPQQPPARPPFGAPRPPSPGPQGFAPRPPSAGMIGAPQQPPAGAMGAPRPGLGAPPQPFPSSPAQAGAPRPPGAPGSAFPPGARGPQAPRPPMPMGPGVRPPGGVAAQGIQPQTPFQQQQPAVRPGAPAGGAFGQPGSAQQAVNGGGAFAQPNAFSQQPGAPGPFAQPGTQGSFPPRQPAGVLPRGAPPAQAPMHATAPALTQRGSMMTSLDPASQCPPQFCQFTFDKFPSSENVRVRAGNAPIAAIYRPFCDLAGTPPVPVVNFGSIPVVRCRRCRSYISPFATFIENGRRWQCALCWNVNEVESEYYAPLDPNTGKRVDHYDRAELNSGIIEIIAPDEYMIRPPAPPAFVFAIDVSKEAISSGLLYAVCEGVKRSLSYLPGQPRTQVGFVTFDSEVHYYDLSGGPEGKGGPRMLVVSDLPNLFHPTAVDELLVDLVERRSAIETLLDQLPTMHAGLSTDAALGPAIQAAFDLLAPLGGKLSIFQAQLPMIVDLPPGDERDKEQWMSCGGLPKPGRGADGRALGSPAEHELFRPATLWYQSHAEAFIRQHINVDWYCCTSVYCDLSTCAELCHLTAGRLRYYPRFHVQRDSEKLVNDIYRTLTGACATEAVMRVRASSGIRVNRFHGSFSLRAKDLLALPMSDPDAVETFEFVLEEDLLPGNFVTFQSAVLYTNLNGERRIRVTNHAMPLTNNPTDVVTGASPEALASLWFKRAIEEARMDGGLDNARNQLKVAFWRLLETPGLLQNSPQFVDSLARLVVGAVKSPALRGGTDIGPDERYYLLRMVGRASIERLDRMMRPKLYSLNVASSEPPAEVPPSRNSLSRDGLFLLDSGTQVMLWVGSGTPQPLLIQLFGDRANAAGLRLTPAGPSDPPVKKAILEIWNQARNARPEDYVPLVVAMEGDASTEPRVYWGLTNDPSSFRGGEITPEELIARGSKVAAAGVSRPGATPGPLPPRMAPGQAPPAGMPGAPGTPSAGMVPRGIPAGGMPPASPGMSAPGQQPPRPTQAPGPIGMGAQPPRPGMPPGAMPPRPMGPYAPNAAMTPQRQGPPVAGQQPLTQQRPSSPSAGPAVLTGAARGVPGAQGVPPRGPPPTGTMPPNLQAQRPASPGQQMPPPPRGAAGPGQIPGRGPPAPAPGPYPPRGGAPSPGPQGPYQGLGPAPTTTSGAVRPASRDTEQQAPRPRRVLLDLTVDEILGFDLNAVFDAERVGRLEQNVETRSNPSDDEKSRRVAEARLVFVHCARERCWHSSGERAFAFHRLDNACGNQRPHNAHEEYIAQAIYNCSKVPCSRCYNTHTSGDPYTSEQYAAQRQGAASQ